MNTKISLSFLAITGALMSAEASYAQASHPNIQNLVTNNTFGAEMSGVNSSTSFGLVDREAAQFNENDSTDRNEVNSRAKNREVRTADLDAKIDRTTPRSDRSRQQSVFESDELDRDLTPPKRGNSIHTADTNHHQRSNSDPEDIARRNLSVPSLSSPQSADIARRNLSVPSLSSPQSADIARRNLSVPSLSSPQSADAARRNLSIPNLSSPKSDSDNLGIPNNQTNVFSSDVAVRTNAPKPNVNKPTTKEILIAIPVPPPRTRQTRKSNLVTPPQKISSATAKPKLPKREFAPVSFQQSHKFNSDVAVIDRSSQIIDRSDRQIDRNTKLNPNLIAAPANVSISIPVTTPRTQKINKVPSVTKMPVVAQRESRDPVASKIPMGQDGYPTSAVKKAKPISPAIPMGQAGYAIPVAKAKPISPSIPMGQGGYPTSVAKVKPLSPAIPMGQAGYVNTTNARSTPLSPPDGGMTTSGAVAIYPLQNPAPITSKFGWRTHPLTGNRRFHSGVDIGAAMGAPVVATGSGTVVSAGWKGGYGKAVIVEHNGVEQTLYGHLSEISVQAGQTIAQGTVLGMVGSTGNSTGPHLHFETRRNSSDGWVATDPSEEVNYAMDTLQRSMPYVRRDSPSGF
jgi:murein DD-endopeptidase MepM/ murein hydrolase activator NlpD